MKKIILTSIIILGIIKVCSLIPQSRLGDTFTEQLIKFRERGGK